MRTFITVLLFVNCLYVSSQSLNKQVASALENIQQGAIQQGVNKLRNAASFNTLAAQYYMGICFEYGIGIEKNPQEAFAMFRKAAERGLPDAMYKLANLYSNGFGVEKDLNRSKEWMSRYLKKNSQQKLPDLIALYNEGISHHSRIASVSDEGNKNATTSAYTKPENSTSVNSMPANYVPLALQNAQQDNAKQSTSTATKSDIDIDIPVTGSIKDNTFVVVIANENYQEETNVEYALHDGETFSEYCRKTLGIPKENIHFRKDATFNNIKAEISWMEQVAKAYKEEAEFIFYYAGHGFPDESSRKSYLLPVDGNGSITSTGYSLPELYRQLGTMPSKLTIVFLDACFSGAKRSEGMLASARGIALKVKDENPTGNVLVFTVANGQQTAYPYDEKGHGLFTYYILEALKSTKGNTTLGELYDFVSDKVSKQSVVINGKPQTPSIFSSPAIVDKWRNIKF